MNLGRRKKFEADPKVQYPRRRETDIDAELRAEEIADRAKTQAEAHTWITRREVRQVRFGREYQERPHGKLFELKNSDKTVRTPYGARTMKLRRTAAKAARQARAANFRRLAVARRQRQSRRRQGR